MASNMQINQTSYYLLPCGKYLEDFIYAKGLNFNMGSAVKYRWRAGNKDGESKEKDLAKCEHYVKLEAKKRKVPLTDVNSEVCGLVVEATEWDGEEEHADHKNNESEVVATIPPPIEMNKINARWRYEACLRVLDDLLFLAREREYSWIEALALSARIEVCNIGLLCGIVGCKDKGENKANP